MPFDRHTYHGLFAPRKSKDKEHQSATIYVTTAAGGGTQAANCEAPERTSPTSSRRPSRQGLTPGCRPEMKFCRHNTKSGANATTFTPLKCIKLSELLSLLDTCHHSVDDLGISSGHTEKITGDHILSTIIAVIQLRILSIVSIRNISLDAGSLDIEISMPLINLIPPSIESTYKLHT